jgi:hypothetical protein
MVAQQRRHSMQPLKRNDVGPAQTVKKDLVKNEASAPKYDPILFKAPFSQKSNDVLSQFTQRKMKELQEFEMKEMKKEAQKVAKFEK